MTTTSPRRLTAQQIGTIASAVDVSIPVDSPATLIPRAITHYNQRARPGVRPATLGSSEEFLARITVNYLRHVCSHYDRYRDQVRNLHEKDRDEIGRRLKGRVLASIAHTYPWLETACREAAAWEDRHTHPRQVN